jgi:hypothetical protein
MFADLDIMECLTAEIKMLREQDAEGRACGSWLAWVRA